MEIGIDGHGAIGHNHAFQCGVVGAHELTKTGGGGFMLARDLGICPLLLLPAHHNPVDDRPVVW